MYTTLEKIKNSETTEVLTGFVTLMLLKTKSDYIKFMTLAWKEHV